MQQTFSSSGSDFLRRDKNKMLPQTSAANSQFQAWFILLDRKEFSFRNKLRYIAPLAPQRKEWNIHARPAMCATSLAA